MKTGGRHFESGVEYPYPYIRHTQQLLRCEHRTSHAQRHCIAEYKAPLPYYECKSPFGVARWVAVMRDELLSWSGKVKHCRAVSLLISLVRLKVFLTFVLLFTFDSGYLPMPPSFCLKSVFKVCFGPLECKNPSRGAFFLIFV
jgi:hypothetical protein